MRAVRLVVLILVGGIAGLGVFAARKADAIPAFSRKYQISCSTCHGPFPRLKPFGEEFAARGYRLPDGSPEPADSRVDAGDGLLKLPRELPLSVRLEGFASWKEKSVATTDVEWPWVFKLLSAGPITDDISYFFYFLQEKGEVVGLEDAFVQFNSAFRLPIDLQVGQFQVSDPLFKRELRLERFDYAIFATHVGHSPLDLTYDRGIAATWHAPGKVDAVFQIVNGAGIGAADGVENFDRDKFKNASVRLVRRFGNARIGVFGYQGRDTTSEGTANRVTFFGPDVVLDLGNRWVASAEYLERRDDDPFFTGARGQTFKTRGGFVELHYFPRGQDGRWVLSALYNRVRSDDPAARTETASVTVNYLLARNVRLMAEAGRDLEAHATRATIGFVTAF